MSSTLTPTPKLELDFSVLGRDGTMLTAPVPVRTVSGSRGTHHASCVLAATGSIESVVPAYRAVADPVWCCTERTREHFPFAPTIASLLSEVERMASWLHRPRVPTTRLEQLAETLEGTPVVAELAVQVRDLLAEHWTRSSAWMVKDRDEFLDLMTIAATVSPHDEVAVPGYYPPTTSSLPAALEQAREHHPELVALLTQLSEHPHPDRPGRLLVWSPMRNAAAGSLLGSALESYRTSPRTLVVPRRLESMVQRWQEVSHAVVRPGDTDAAITTAVSLLEDATGLSAAQALKIARAL